MDDEVRKPRRLAEIEADIERTVRRVDNTFLLLAVMAAAAMAWLTTPHQRASILETWRETALQQRLCRAYIAVAPDKSYADFPVCLPPIPRMAAHGR